MGTTRFSVLTILFVIFAFVPHAFSRGAPQLDLPEGAKARLSTDYTESVKNIAFSPDGQILASDSHNNIKGAKVHLWDPITGELRHVFAWAELGAGWELMQGVFGVAFTPDSQMIAAAVDDSLTLWDIKTEAIARVIYTGHEEYEYIHTASNIAFDPGDGKKLVFGGFNGQVHLWDLQSSTQPVNVSAVHPKSHPKVTLGVREHGLTGHTDIVTAVAVSPNRMQIASGGFDHTVRLWGWRTRWGTLFDDVHDTLKGHTDVVYSVAFSPDGKVLASGSSDNTIRLWKVDTLELDDTLKADDMGWVFSVAFSPDGKMLASGGDWNDLRLWDVRTRPSRLLRTFRGHTGRIYSVAFSPDGKTLASGSEDGTVLLWEVPSLPLLRVQTPAARDPKPETSPQKTPPEEISSEKTPPEEISSEKTPPQSLVFTRINRADLPPIYWVDSESKTLYRLTDGEVAPLLPNVRNATDLAIDGVGGKLYWIEKTGERTGRIRRANLDGSNVQLVKNLTSVPLDLAVDTVNRKIYLTNSWGKVQRLNVDGSNFQPNLITGLKTLRGLALNTSEGTVYWIEQTGKRTGRIRRANLDGSNVRLVKNLTSVPQGITVDAANRKLYITNTYGKVQRLNLNGKNYQPNLITGLDAPTDITVNAAEGKVYWTEAGRVRRADLNGKNIEEVVSGLGAPSGITLGVVADARVAAAPKASESGTAAEETTLLANYPNPFNPETWIPYQLAVPADVSISIYAANGRLVRTLAFRAISIPNRTDRDAAVRYAIAQIKALGHEGYTKVLGVDGSLNECRSL